MISRWTRNDVRLGLLSVVAISLLTPKAQAITWGEPDVDAAYPNVGAIVVTIAETGERVAFCSGTLIAPQVLLTAGHCTGPIPQYLEAGLISDVAVSFDFDPTAADATLYPASDYITHPLFNNFAQQARIYDLGAVVLQQPPAIAPAQIASEGFLDELKAAKLLKGKHTPFRVVGFGTTILFPPPAVVPQGTRYYADSLFRGLPTDNLLLHQNHRSGAAGSCYGDSGGPVLYTDAAGNDTLVAVVSWGDPHCVSTAFNYRVDLASSLDFIDSVIAP